MQHSTTKKSVSIPGNILGISCLLIMVYAYAFAPLQPTLTNEFGSNLIKLAIPVFALSFALSAAGMAFLPRIIDLKRCLIIGLMCLCAGSFLLSHAQSAKAFLLLRALTGLGTGIMLPSALMLASVGQKKSGLTNLIMVMFALATGITFGPSLGGWINELLTWQLLYKAIASFAAILIVFAYPHLQQRGFVNNIQPHRIKILPVFQIVWRSKHSYIFVFITALFHSGVFVWISFYFTSQYRLNEYDIATDLIIFGLPGLAFTFILFRSKLDTQVLKILYAGLALTIGGLLMLTANLPLWLAECLLAVMSVGFSCSQPIFIGILKMPSGIRPIAVGCAILFAGYGSGPLLMVALLNVHMGLAIAFLIVLVLILAWVSRYVWQQSYKKVKVYRNVPAGFNPIPIKLHRN